MPAQEIVHGDCLEKLKLLRSNCIDSVPTDPPYELNFMNASWDRSGIAFNAELWREVYRVMKPGAHLAVHAAGRLSHRVVCAVEDVGFEVRELIAWIFGTGQFLGKSLGDGQGTRLKTAAEPIWLFRKPAEGTIQETKDLFGTGGFQVERNRLDGGRLPSNLGIDDEVAADLGDRARYFYCVKASRPEKDAGLDDFPIITGGDAVKRKEGSAGLKNARAGAGRTGGGRNPHSTVKPLALVRWIIRLITPPGGVVLDPFAGSGTTGCAAALEGFDFIGIERESEYVKIAEARIAHWSKLQSCEKITVTLEKDLDRQNGQGVEATHSEAAYENENAIEVASENESESEARESVIDIAKLFNITNEVSDMCAWLPAGMATEVANSEAFVRGNRAKDGDYIFMHLSSKYEKTQKGMAVIIEHEVVSATKTVEGVEPNAVGTKVTYFLPDYGGAKVMLQPNLKVYVCGLTGADPKSVSAAALAETIEALGAGYARGMYIRGVTFHTEKKDGEDFTGFNWYPVPGENNVSAAGVVARKAELDKSNGAPPTPTVTTAAPPVVPSVVAPPPPAPPAPVMAKPHLEGWTQNPASPAHWYRYVAGGAVEQKTEAEIAAGR